MNNEYLTTTEAATICHVTRFTIANWEKHGKLKTNKTVGGHRRIRKKDLLALIKNKRLLEIDNSDDQNLDTIDAAAPASRAPGNRVKDFHPKDSEYRIPSCWEFRFKNQDKHNCVNCLVFKERANKCFLISRVIGTGTVRCQEECLNCEYLNKFYPSKKRILVNTKNDTPDHIMARNHKRGEGTPAIFKKGLYTSGKYVASIEKVIFRKGKKG